VERELLGKDFVVCEVMPYAMRGGAAVPYYPPPLRRAPPKSTIEDIPRAVLAVSNRLAAPAPRGPGMPNEGCEALAVTIRARP